MKIDNETLHKIIQEEVQKILTEYADPRNKFIDRVDSILPQLVENWSLVHICTITDTDYNRCKNHWKSELRNAFAYISNKSIKNNNSYDARYKAIIEGISYSELLDNESAIYNQIKVKFLNENINLSRKVIIECIHHLIENKAIIIDLLAKQDIDNIIDYINEI